MFKRSDYLCTIVARINRLQLPAQGICPSYELAMIRCTHQHIRSTILPTQWFLIKDDSLLWLRGTSSHTMSKWVVITQIWLNLRLSVARNVKYVPGLRKRNSISLRIKKMISAYPVIPHTIHFSCGAHNGSIYFVNVRRGSWSQSAVVCTMLPVPASLTNLRLAELGSLGYLIRRKYVVIFSSNIIPYSHVGCESLVNEFRHESIVVQILVSR